MYISLLLKMINGFSWPGKIMASPFKGYCTPNLELACFVCYLKIVNTNLWKIMYASYSKFSKELKNSIKI